MGMKALLTLILVVLHCTCAPAQSSVAPDGSVLSLERARLHQQRTAMYVLGGWAVANIGLGLGLRAGRTGEARRFHEMNAIWNTVNLGIAGFGLWSVLRADPAALDAFGSLRENDGLQKILLLNTGLDVAYIVGGLYLKERARRPDADADRLRGYGRSIVLQGGFLLAFDLVNYFIAAGRTGAYAPLLGATADGLGLSLRF